MKHGILSGIVSAAIGLALLLPGAASASSLASTGTCHGRPVSIIATGPTVTGTPGNDTIIARGDTTGVQTFTINTGAGDDFVCVWFANAVVDLGAGNDYFQGHNLHTAKWYDVQAHGGSGNDAILAGMAGPHSRVYGDGGEDTCSRYATLGQSKHWLDCEHVRINRYEV